MVQTIPIYDILTVWRDILSNDIKIKEFCLEKYHKEPKIYLGIDLKNPPSVLDCPLIILCPGTKIEGEDEEEFRYAISVSWGIVNEKRKITGNIIEYFGIKEADEFGQLILLALSEANQDHPISSVHYELDSLDFFPQHCGEMRLEITVPRLMGAEMKY
jgi:hypothetical protein